MESVVIREPEARAEARGQVAGRRAVLIPWLRARVSAADAHSLGRRVELCSRELLDQVTAVLARERDSLALLRDLDRLLPPDESLLVREFEARGAQKALRHIVRIGVTDRLGAVQAAALSGRIERSSWDLLEELAQLLVRERDETALLRELEHILPE